MNPSPLSRNGTPATLSDLLFLLLTYSELLKARNNSLENSLSPWAKPLCIAHSCPRDMPEPVFLWMVYQNHVVHIAGDLSKARLSSGRLATTSLCLTPSSFYVLTDEGAAFATEITETTYRALVNDGHTEDRLLENDNLDASDVPACGSFLQVVLNEVQLSPLRPRYDTENRVFRWGNHILKHFKQRRGPQELVLMAAEELNWPDWFDDPLTKLPGKNAKVRLHDTIKDLNRRQRAPLIHFRANGNGKRIGWELR
jgi:hypothetical protein